MRPPIASAAIVAAAALLAATALLAVALVPVASAAPVVGSDVSWPQCNDAQPARRPFGIVGVTGGVVFMPNPCLAEEIGWVDAAHLQLYMNTGNAGPGVSTHWPIGHTSPRVCSAAAPDTAACAYDHGWDAAADAYAGAAAAFHNANVGRSPSTVPWWLDVETTNSWRDDTSLNVADLSGALAYLLHAGVPVVGFYSTALQWGVITGGTTAFRGHPSWVAGASDQADAQAGCADPGFTGGPVDIVQFLSDGVDLDVLCRPVLPPPSAKPTRRIVRMAPPLPAARRLTPPVPAHSAAAVPRPVQVSPVTAQPTVPPSPPAAQSELPPLPTPVDLPALGPSAPPAAAAAPAAAPLRSVRAAASHPASDLPVPVLAALLATSATLGLVLPLRGARRGDAGPRERVERVVR
ncbi:MAG TPA: hypothetical protein VEY67_08385 [Candidatus Dormibacteraeota bacterium]|nr:hypothetical protein [Candidatus Dormibacteraeota bacterium]